MGGGEGCKGRGQILLKNFFLPKNRFLAAELKRVKQKVTQIFSKRLFGRCTDRRKMKNLRFVRHRIKISESPVYEGRQEM